jgi:hypothetical protein
MTCPVKSAPPSRIPGIKQGEDEGNAVLRLCPSILLGAVSLLIKAIESEPLAWETPEGWKIMRKGDHSVVEDVVWGETMFSDKYGFAVLKNLQSIQAEQICRTPEELKAVRDSYEKRMKEAKK